jgi:hypothetical protein
MLSLLTEKIPQVVCTILVVLALLVNAPVIAHAHSEIAGQRSAQETRHMVPKCGEEQDGTIHCSVSYPPLICWDLAFTGYVLLCGDTRCLPPSTLGCNVGAYPLSTNFALF